MAAVSLSPLPHDLSSMSTRRPLSSNPNAVNSPYRPAAASKQKRSYAHLQREDAYGQPPPAKKQMLDGHTSRTPPRQIPNQSFPENRIFTRKSNTQFSTYERKAAPSTREAVQQLVKKSEKTPEQDLETIRQWQKHYQKQFPSFVFYFESVPEEARARYTKQVVALGAVSPSYFLPCAMISNYGCSARRSSFPMRLLMLLQRELFQLNRPLRPPTQAIPHHRTANPKLSILPFSTDHQSSIVRMSWAAGPSSHSMFLSTGDNHPKGTKAMREDNKVGAQIFCIRLGHLESKYGLSKNYNV